MDSGSPEPPQPVEIKRTVVELPDATSVPGADSPSILVAPPSRPRWAILDLPLGHSSVQAGLQAYDTESEHRTQQS